MNPYSISKSPKEVSLVLANKIKDLRKQKNWTQTELAQHAEISVASLRRFEQTGKIALNSLLKIVHVLNRLSDFDNVLATPEESRRIESLFSLKMNAE